jgi:Flp pilus assembly protein TadG
MAEFSLVLPVLVLLLFGIVQFGIVFNHYLALTDAVRAGGRVASVARHYPETERTARIEAKVRAAATDLQDAKLKVFVTEPDEWQPGEDVVVEATYPYEINLIGLVVKDGELQSKTTERVE